MKTITPKNVAKLLFFVLILLSQKLFSQCPTPPGNQSSFGAGSWIGYVYNAVNTSNPPTNAFTTTYRGYITQPEIFNLDLGTGALSGSNLCGTYTDQFSIRFKMTQNFPAGNYSFEVGGDDGYRLSFDGGATFPISNWNEHSYTSSTGTYYLSGNVNLVLEYFEQGGSSRISFSYANCTHPSTAPTAITGTNSICSGSSTTLTATGGTIAATGIYQWGTGTIGNNIISGQTGASITVSPTTNTTYWVRRVDPAPCASNTAGISQTVSVVNVSTAPTSISGITTICLGNSTTLTASGGSLGSNGTYEWGTGYTAGLNIIPGATSSTLTVNPTTTTGYWVRRVDSTPCSTSTTAAATTVNVNTPPGDQTTYGSNSWIGYVYSGLDASNPPSNIATATYRGYITQPEIFDYDLNNGSVSGGNLCGTYADQFFIRYKMTRNFTAGYYTFTVGGDDGYRLSLDGGATFLISNFVDHSYASSTSSTIYLNGNIDLVLEYYEQGTYSRLSFNYTSCTNFSTAPTGISTSTSLCYGSGGTTLTATGGYAAPGATYQWGTGNVVGVNPIAGVTYNGYYVNPATTTTYWVRRIDGAPCNLVTDGFVQTITVATRSTQPTNITPNTTICAGNNVTLTASGGTLGTNGVYEWGTGYNAGVNIISGQSGSSITVSPTSTTGYWVRRVDSAPCNIATGHITTTVTVNNTSTAPTGITGSTSLCYGSGGTTITAIGGSAASGATYQWGIGNVVGTNPIGGINYNGYYINPTTTTTYWVRRVDGSPCNQATAGYVFTVNVATRSTQPTNITPNTTICSGNSITLTASGATLGTNGVYEWGTGYSAGVNTISGQSGASITVSPNSTTGYWVRRVDSAPCNISTGHITTTITVNNASTAPTSITGAGAAACAGGSYTLTAIGGTAAAGSTYQWGTGNIVGTNTITGNGASITVSPTTTTTYWVRRYDPSCTSYTGGITTTVTITAPPGDPAIFGNNIWNVYGYSTADITLASTVYAGYYSVNTLNFDTQSGTNSWNSSASPSSSSGWSGCTVPVDNFTFVAKRKGFPCGTYTIAMQNWDDAAQFYLNGILIWSNGNWSGIGNYNLVIGSYSLDSTSEIEVRIREGAGAANLSFTLINTNVASTAPTAISGTVALCPGSNTTLTAFGGTLGTTGSYEWGTGSIVGTNPILGQTSSSINVSPTSDTTYWVRRIDSLCGNTTSGITQLVTITAPTVAGTISTTATTICRNTSPNAITLTGNTGNVVKWQYANDSGFTSGVTDIAVTSTTLSGTTIGNLSATRYFRAVVQNGSCTIAYTPSLGIIVPTAVTYNGSWSGTPSSTTPVIISSNLSLNNNLNVCSCQITNNAVVTVGANVSLIIHNDLSIASTASLIIENNGSLVQVSDTASDIGNVIFKRNTTPLKQYDYTYWSSPLLNQTLNQLGSPSLFYAFNPSINNWSSATSSTIMAAAKGYISRVPNNLNFSNPQILSVIFTGIPNNGVISTPIIKSTGTFNLIGNPYPSAIDIDAFLLDPANTGVVNGTIYLWTHNTAIANTIPGTDIYNYTRDDYAKYNITGGVKTAAAAVTGGSEPTGKIAAGQGFFIEANSSLGTGTYSATFRNNMRLVNNNDQFFRINPANSGNAPVSGAIQKNRVWLNISNTTGAYDETLVGYITGATNGFDNLYDGKTFPAGNVVSIYSLFDSGDYSIQGRALPFNPDDIVPLGITTTIGGDFSINLEKFDGLFHNQDVYLLDKSTGLYHNLKSGGYNFNITSGTYDDRFELRFTDGTSLGTANPVVTENNITIIRVAKHLEISADNISIDKIQLFDLLGKNLYHVKDINATEFKTSDLNIATQIIIAKITLDNGQVISKKVLFNKE